MKIIDIFLKKCSKQRIEYVKRKVGWKSKGFDEYGTLWITMSKSYNESFNIKKNVKYFTLYDSQNRIDFKCIDNILLFCGSKQKIWQLRLFSNSADKFEFQVICEWNLSSGKKNTSKKTECGQKLMTDFSK
jgi:hypothetical protein